MSRKLHIGGEKTAPGWEILNIVPAPYVDHLGNAKDLSQFPDKTFTDIYASHILEHLDYVREINEALMEWYRVLKPGGKVCISVPDFDVLAQLFISKDKFNLDERFWLMRIIFGGHIDKHDYHVVGLNQEFLEQYLLAAGFVNIRRIENFGLFEDTSSLQFKGVPISVNMTAEKPTRIAEKMAPPAKRGNVGRNEPCPCGSGKKYKHCHGSHG